MFQSKRDEKSKTPQRPLQSMGRISPREAHDISCRRSVYCRPEHPPASSTVLLTVPLRARGAEPVPGYGGKQQPPRVLFKKDTVHMGDTILSLVIPSAIAFRSGCDLRSREHSSSKRALGEMKASGHRG